MLRKVVIDTDTHNEVDDQFAIAYLLAATDVYDVLAITIAPYVLSRTNITPKQSVEESYKETLHMLNLMGLGNKIPVFKGSEGFMSEGYSGNSDAVNKLIELALSVDKLTILSIGVLTNIALAIKKEPKIINKIEVVWVGSHPFLAGRNLDSNFRKDANAVNEILESNVELTIIPTKGVASTLVTSTFEIDHYLKGKGGICDYLSEITHKFFYTLENYGRKILYDTAAVAYFINPEWFSVRRIPRPKVGNNYEFIFNKTPKKMNYVYGLNTYKIVPDCFFHILKFAKTTK